MVGAAKNNPGGRCVHIDYVADNGCVIRPGPNPYRVTRSVCNDIAGYRIVRRSSIVQSYPVSSGGIPVYRVCPDSTVFA